MHLGCWAIFEQNAGMDMRKVTGIEEIVIGAHVAVGIVDYEFRKAIFDAITHEID